MNPTTPLPSGNTNTKKGTPDSVNKRQLRELLKGVIAYVDVRLDKKDFSDCVASELTKLGATVVDGFLPEVTHLVFFGGYRRTYSTGLRRKIHIVAPHWISDSKAKMCKQNEENYIPDMPPPKEEVPFFRKRKYKPIVDQILAGTYVPMDQRDANYVEPRLVKSAPRKFNTQVRTPRTPSGTPKAGGTAKRTRKKIISPETESQKMLDAFSSDEDEYIRSLFDGVNISEGGSLVKVISDGLKAMKEKCSGDKYNLWVDSPVTTTKGNEDDDTYVPLFERCRAKLLAENKIKPPSFYQPVVVQDETPPMSEPQIFPNTPLSLESDDRLAVHTSTYKQDEDNMSNEILSQKKRGASPVLSSSKKLKLTKTPAPELSSKGRRKSIKKSNFFKDHDKNIRNADGQGKIDDYFNDNTKQHEVDALLLELAQDSSSKSDDKIKHYSSVSDKHFEGRRKSSRLPKNMYAFSSAKNQENVSCPDGKESIENGTTTHSLISTSPQNSLRDAATSSSDGINHSDKKLKRKIKSNSQPSRRSTRLSMRVQINMDRFLIPNDVKSISETAYTDSSSACVSDFLKMSTNDENLTSFSNELCIQNKTPFGNTIATTNLHQWEKDFLISTLDNIGGLQLVDKIEDCDTVLVSGNNRRTLKIMLGISFGCWIVSLDWVTESAKHGCWMDVKDFEITYFPAAVETRMERISRGGMSGYSKDLFSKCGGIFITKECKPSKKEIEELVISCKGQVVHSLHKADICIGHAGKNVDVKWVFDSITSNICLDVELYKNI